ncbi:MAG TPA: hypothetical protein PLO14_07785 [Accumulibacter sp.]|uniref:hypothetical protein n=1 Tax=Accumulibacter sp. TaxID=2053492 RepID=UPI0025F959BA|nr:hypothetical protein [Accumulibacter sp.]MCM8597977.1 hypothetical protein [Accumulibacter sp.]MCM8662138.1 hypothetical protein [Accumulibacter sp.]HNC52121.1 hypothetical protein [Accumulibacter sp.]
MLHTPIRAHALPPASRCTILAQADTEARPKLFVARLLPARESLASNEDCEENAPPSKESASSIADIAYLFTSPSQTQLRQPEWPHRPTDFLPRIVMPITPVCIIARSVINASTQDLA